jgi:hypothetical protein
MLRYVAFLSVAISITALLFMGRQPGEEYGAETASEINDEEDEVPEVFLVDIDDAHPVPEAVLPSPTNGWERSVVQDGPKVLSPLLSQIESVLTENRLHKKPEVSAIILVESMGDPKADNPRGGRGLMGVTPVVCKQLKWRKKCNLFNPATNLSLGSGYLDYLEEQGFEGNEKFVAYKEGPTGARRFLRQNNPEDHPYVQRVNFALEHAAEYVR